MLTKSTFLRKHTPPNVAILHLLVYANPKCKMQKFSGQKWDFKILYFSPIIKSMFCLYNFEKSLILQFILIISNFFPIDLLLLGSKLWQKARLQVEIMKN